jgi:hypothetical protein
MFDRRHSRWTSGRTLGSRRAALAALAALCLLAAPAQAEDRFEDLGPKTFDAAVLRPLTLIQVAAGFVLFLPAGALSASLGYLASPSASATTAKTNFDDAWDVFVREPYERAIPRPLGAW